jgi:hypothetical protein
VTRLALDLDQNYLSGLVKRKVAFRELEPTLRAAVARGAVVVPESEAHRIESAARPDLPLLELLRELSAGVTLPNQRGALERHCERRLEAILERDFPERRAAQAMLSGCVCSQSPCRAAASSPATPSWPTSSAGPVSTCASAESSSPGAGPTSSGCAHGSSVSPSRCRAVPSPPRLLALARRELEA